jgi:hypothetical protein
MNFKYAMTLRLKSFFFVLALFLLTIQNALPQSLTDLEKNYYTTEKNLKKEKIVLDSLKLVLNAKGNEIDIEKNKKNADKDKIVELMSALITVSNKYDAQQKKVVQLQTKFESSKIELDKEYSAIIDSLKTLQSSGEFRGDMNKLNSDILYYTETKLAIGPKISLLSFDPSKLLKIDPNKSRDSLEKAIYMEYLQDALSEVDYHLKNINEQHSEINQMLALEKKTEKFLKETEFQKGIRTQSSNRSGTNSESLTDEATFGGVNNRDNAVKITEQFRVYTLLLNQLNVSIAEDLSATDKLEWGSEGERLSLKEYRNLLEELRKKLQDYKLVLGNKIGVPRDY